MSGKKYPVSLPIRVIDEATADIKKIKNQFRGIVDPVSKVNRSLRLMNKELKSLTYLPQKVGKGMQKLGKDMAFKIGAPAAAAGASIFSFVGRYEDELLFLQNITKSTTKEIERFDKAAREIGKKKPINALEAIKGFVAAKVSGTDTKDLISIMPPTVDLSIAWKADLSEAAALVGTIRQKTKRDATDIVDIISTSMLESNIKTLDEFREIYKNVGEIFNIEGMSLEEFGVAATLVGQAMKGDSQGGTHLKIAISRLAQGNSEVKKALKGVGGQIEIKPSDFLDENYKITSFEKLAKTFSRIAGDTGRMAQIFGSEAASTMQSIFTDGVKRYNQIISTQRENMSEGITGKSADAFMEGSLGKWRRLVGSVGELAIRIGKDAKFDEMIGGYLDEIREFVDELAGMDTESLLLIAKMTMGTVAFSAGLAALGGFINLVSAGVGPLISLSVFLFKASRIKQYIFALQVAGRVVKIFGSNLMWAMRGSKLFSLLKGGLVALGSAAKAHPILALLSLLITGAYLVYDNWDTIFPWLQEKWEMVKEVVDGVIESVSDLFDFGDSFSFFKDESQSLNFKDRLSTVKHEESLRVSSLTSSNAKISVDFQNVPRGVVIKQKENKGLNLDLNQGFALSDFAMSAL